MPATVKRHKAPSGNPDADRFQALCAEHPGWITAAHSNRTVEGKSLAERDRVEHNRFAHAGHS